MTQASRKLSLKTEPLLLEYASMTLTKDYLRLSSENHLLIMRSKELAVIYRDNWKKHKEHS
jgi:hypothetical protein